MMKHIYEVLSVEAKRFHSNNTVIGGYYIVDGSTTTFHVDTEGTLHSIVDQVLEEWNDADYSIPDSFHVTEQSYDVDAGEFTIKIEGLEDWQIDAYHLRDPEPIMVVLVGIPKG